MAPGHRETRSRLRRHVRIATPYDWPAWLAFLAARATPGVESVADGRYWRTIDVGGEAGVVSVGFDASRPALVVDIGGTTRESSSAVVRRIHRLCDVDCDPEVVGDWLRRDPLLAPRLARHAGIRVPGAWDGFELAVRAVLGQQVSVRAATTIAGRVAARFGTCRAGDVSLTHLFPTAVQLAEAPLEQVGVLPSRARTIRVLAQRVADGAIDVGTADTAATVAALRRIPGIGPWTTAYIAMRACGDRDAWLTGDLVLRRATGGFSSRALDARAERWRPWRAYAVMLLWSE